MKINLHLPVNFPFAALIILIIGLMFTGYIYMTANSVIADVSTNGLVSTAVQE